MPRIAPNQPFYPPALPSPRPPGPIRLPGSFQQPGSTQQPNLNHQPSSVRQPGPGPRSLPRRELEALARGRSVDVLRRLEDGDPLELARRVELFLERRCLLLDHSRVLARVWLLLARDAGRLGRRAFAPGRLEACVERAATSALREAGARPPGPRLTSLARELGLSAGGLARACDELNRRPRVEREAFFALVIDRRQVESLLRPGGPSAPWLVAAARRALAPFLEAEGCRDVGAGA